MGKSKSSVEAIAALLVKNGALGQEEARAASDVFANYSEPIFTNFLFEEGIAPKVQILKALSDYHGRPAMDAVGYFFDRNLLRKFPKDFLLRNNIIPLERDQNILIMVANSPDDPDLLYKIGQHVSYDIRFYVGMARDIQDAVKEYYDKADTEVTE